MIDRRDIPTIAALLVDVGQRLGRLTTWDGKRMPTGEAALLAAQTYAPGPRAHNTDPETGGNRWEPDEESGELEPVPIDPTGETGAGSDPTSLLAARLSTLLGWLQDNAIDARNLVAELIPHQPNVRVVPCMSCGGLQATTTKRPQDLVGADVAAAGWCKSCYRDDGYMAPIETDRNGNRYYRDHCRWCGTFKANHGGKEPPVAVLAIKHRYGRVSVDQVERSCAHCIAAAKAKAKASAS